MKRHAARDNTVRRRLIKSNMLGAIGLIPRQHWQEFFLKKNTYVIGRQ
jgi:hypothetical protein